MIDRATGKHKSVISRELKRNVDPKGKYTFAYAQDMSELRKERMKKPRKLLPGLKKKIIPMIEEDLSSQQIERRLNLENQPFVSYETVYKMIREDKGAGGELYKYTRHQLKHRKRPAGEKIPVKNRGSIDQRPETVNFRLQSYIFFKTNFSTKFPRANACQIIY